MSLTQRRVHEQADGERRGCEGHVLQCDGRSMLSCVGSHRSVHEGALCVPAVHANMHVISDFGTGITWLGLSLGQRRSHCLSP